MTALGPGLGAVDARFRRQADQVMRLDRLGAAHPTRLSFLRILLRRIRREGWVFSRPVFEFDRRGVGRAVYCAHAGERTYSLVAFGHDIPASARSDRVIATEWDVTFCLYDGAPDADALDRLSEAVPLQEAARVTDRVLCLGRANRSVRVFDHVVEALSRGAAPDEDALAAAGYLLRTTAVYGSGKFGAAAFTTLADRPECAAPFQMEMLAVWLVRSFAIDLVEEMARQAGGASAARLDQAAKRRLGVGNSTGLGMAPFLVRRPLLLDAWVAVREEALARVRAQTKISARAHAGFQRALDDARCNAALWRSEHPFQTPRLAELRAGLEAIAIHAAEALRPTEPYPWDGLWSWAEANTPLEAQEALVACMLEPHGALIDDLAVHLSADEADAMLLDGSMTAATLRDLLERAYRWALDIDLDDPQAQALFWYVSEDKLEPRLGARSEEPGAERELPLDIARRAQALYRALQARPGAEPIAKLLLESPDLRLMARRAQAAASRPYAEIQENLIAADVAPIHMLRCKLAFFGATRFDPGSDRWVRISLFQDCPHPDEVAMDDQL